MRIKNINGLSAQSLQEEVEKGSRFLHYSYAVSLVIVTFKHNSDVYMLRKNESAFRKGLRFTILTALFGWWGIPKGPRTTIETLRTNLKGGTDVTGEVMDTVAGHLLFREVQAQKKVS